MKVKNISGQIIKGISSIDPAFGIQYEDKEGNIRASGIAYGVNNGITLNNARKEAKELKEGEDAVKWATVLVYDENGKMQEVSP